MNQNDGARERVMELNRVSRAFGGRRGVYAVRDVTFGVDRGEYVALVGPSGSGKSSLLHILGCLDRPTSGSYAIWGKPVQEFAERQLCEVRRSMMGFVFQAFYLIPRRTVWDNVSLGLLHSELSRGERRLRVKDALAAVGLTERADFVPEQLSGGEKQRCAVARAIVKRPAVLIADEPTGNLDMRSTEGLLDLIGELRGQYLRTLVVATHDPLVSARAERVFEMHNGILAERELGEV
jgi:ABC-type lipoprotein export system ATPase subunit